MKNLVDSMRNEHQFIQKSLEELQFAGINTHEGQVVLSSLKNVICSHFHNEREFLFPFLLVHSRNNENIKRVLNMYLVDYEKLISYFREFFGKYEAKADYDEYQFYTDLYDFSELINLRIKSESNNLFALMEQFSESAVA